MKSSEKAPDLQHSTRRLHILSAGGAVPRTPVPVDNPYRVLDDLMAVVEALCPVWPPRAVDGPMNDMRL